MAKPVDMNNGGRIIRRAETGFFCPRSRRKITAVAMSNGISIPRAVVDRMCMEMLLLTP